MVRDVQGEMLGAKKGPSEGTTEVASEGVHKQKASETSEARETSKAQASDGASKRSIGRNDGTNCNRQKQKMKPHPARECAMQCGNGSTPMRQPRRTDLR